MESNKSRCPNCNAVLTPDFSKRSVMCEQCETLFPVSLFNNTNEEEKNTVTENKEGQETVETDSLPSEMTNEAETVNTDNNYTLSILIFTFIIAVAFSIGLVFYVQRQHADAKAFAMENGWISAGASRELIGLSPGDAQKALQDAGFVKIRLRESTLSQKIINCFSSTAVYDVSINGKNNFTKNDYFPPDADVYIYYSK